MINNKKEILILEKKSIESSEFLVPRWEIHLISDLMAFARSRTLDNNKIPVTPVMFRNSN